MSEVKYIYCCKPRLDCDARENGTCTKDCEYYGGVRMNDKPIIKITKSDKKCGQNKTANLNWEWEMTDKMSEITKLYRNAGVKPLPTCNNCNMLDEYWSNGTYCSTCKYDKDNDECNMANYTYPPFTAEKQIELIKWLARFNVRIEYTEYTNAKYFIESHYHGYSVFMKYFEQALAGFINILWQDLTEQERTEIADILKG